MKLELDEVRRLTGPNLLSDFPGAIIDVFIEGIDVIDVVECWQRNVKARIKELDWSSQHFYRTYDGGASMSISAPMDLLYSACDLVELAWQDCLREYQQPFDEEPKSLAELEVSISDEKSPKLIAMLDTAAQHGAFCLVDDDELSLGAGATSKVFAIDALPNPLSLDWGEFSAVPLALITGTNGKSTSVRLAAEIAKQAGINSGVTSTDFIKVGDTIIDRGDYSGPGGARMLLRDKRTEMAFLEVARGGLLRRGLPVFEANAALVTNVASDHLGQYGINTVDELAEVKLMVANAIKQGSTLVLNADDPRLIKYISKYFAPHYKNTKDYPICWFSLDSTNPMIVQNRKLNKPCVYVENGQFVYHHSSKQCIGNVVDIPMTMNGAANYNIQNALGVIGLCMAMGLPTTAIQMGLLAFGTKASDNPGRGNIYRVQDKTVIVDFAHNAHSTRALMETVKRMSKTIAGSKIHVMFSHAGDRSNNDIFASTDEVCGIAPNSYILAEIEEYLRGRELFEISNLVEQHLLQKGVDSGVIFKVPNPLEGCKIALNNANKGDLVLLFVLTERDEIEQYIQSQM